MKPYLWQLQLLPQAILSTILLKLEAEKTHFPKLTHFSIKKKKKSQKKDCYREMTACLIFKYILAADPKWGQLYELTNLQVPTSFASSTFVKQQLLPQRTSQTGTVQTKGI